MAFKVAECLDVTPVKAKPIGHNVIVDELLKMVTKVDFVLVAFPEVEDLRKRKSDIDKQIKNPDGSYIEIIDAKTKDAYNEIVKQLNSKVPHQKHYIIYTIEELLKLAVKNDWGICKYLAFIYFYNGAYWNVTESDELKAFLSKVAEKMGVSKVDAKFYKFVDDLFKQFQFSANLPKAIPEDSTTLINLLNGTFEIKPKTQVLREPRRKDFMKYQLSFEYNPDATAPMFQKFLDEVLPDIECQTVLAEFIGYVFVHPSVLKLEKTLFCYGSGANGKSVFFEIVRALLGNENISNYSLQSLTDQTGYFRASLQNKLVNYASEISGTVNPALFKQLCSGEPVEARLPYSPPFVLTNYAKMIFNGNVLPKDVEHTNAYFRRFIIIPFNVTIPKERQDKDLDKKIIANELPGIFNWVLLGLKRILKQRDFSNCTAAEQMVADYKTQSDTVALFIEDHNYRVSTTENLQLKALHSEYKAYCIDNGYKPVSNRILADRLRSIGVEVNRNNKGNAVYLTNREV